MHEGVHYPTDVMAGAAIGVGCAVGIAVGLTIAQIFVMNIYYQKYQGINILRFWVEISKMSVIPFSLTIIGICLLKCVDLNSFGRLGLGICGYLIFFIPLFYLFSMNSYEQNLVRSVIKKWL